MHFDLDLYRGCTLDGRRVGWPAKRQVCGALCLLLAFLTLAERAVAEVGLALAPMRVELRLAAGQQHSGALNLTNDSTTKARIRAELLDFFIDSQQTPQFGRAWPQESEHSCRNWLAVNPMEVEMEPGAVTLVRYTLRLPTGLRERSYHCAAGFTVLPTAEELKGTGLRAAVRIVAAFYVIVGNPAIEGGFKEMRLEYASGGQEPGWQAVVVMENRGWMHFRPSGELTLLSEGEVVETSRFQPIPVLPQREQRFLLPLKGPLRPGSYQLRARVDLGGTEIQEATASVVARLPHP